MRFAEASIIAPEGLSKLVMKQGAADNPLLKLPIEKANPGHPLHFTHEMEALLQEGMYDFRKSWAEALLFECKIWTLIKTT